MDNRQRYRSLLAANGINQKESAKLIKMLTRRPCSERAVHSWLNDPEKPSSRNCPDWAVEALEQVIGFMERAVAQGRTIKL